MQWPDLPNLPQLIVEDLRFKNAQAFGTYAIHRNLTRVQLDELLKLRPRLLNEQNFVNTYLSKLAPDNDSNVRFDDQQLIAYLDRLWKFAQTLDPVHNSLKANVLFRRLRADQRMGVYDKARFVEYIKLPRQVHYINPEIIKQLRSSSHLVNLNADFRQFTRLAPIVNDEPLVRDFLHHFLKEQPDYQEFLPWIGDQYLQRQFATVKILHGLGDSERWASMLSPDEFQSLMNRVDIDFAHTNPQEFEVDQLVELDLHVKNVQKLIVKVFEINAANYYKTHGREIDTDINLDGLVPNWQQIHELDSPPLLRVDRKFSFEQLDHRGVYIIDFIGNGKSSRALIRKGRLQHLVTTTIAGQRFTILNENQTAVTNAELWVAGQKFESSDDGSITIPFSTQPKRESAVIQQGDFSSLVYFDHLPEQYNLKAGIYVDREALLRSGRAMVVIRPQLLLSGTPVPSKLLSDIRLNIVSSDLDQVESSKEVRALELSEAGEASYKIQVPPRLHQLSFVLSAKVKNVSQDAEQTLSDQQSFVVNQIDASDSVDDLHLVLTQAGYVLEARGKTGEPRPGQAVLLALKHRDFTQPVSLTLQTDDKGVIELGPLADITTITSRLNQNQEQRWTLHEDRQTVYRSVHGLTGQSISIPLNVEQAEPTEEDFGLLEIRSGTPVADHFEAISLRNGLVTINPLPAGDYQLRLKRSGKTVHIRITEGNDRERYALSRNRALEIRERDPLHVTGMEAGDSSIQLNLGGDTELARVHVFATRYVPRFDVFSIMSAIRDIEPLVVNQGYLPSTYIAGRAIGEEYQYILNRQYAAKFPGVMLTRPSLLLNPWAVRTTENSVQTAQSGEDFFGAQQGLDSKAERESANARGALANVDFSNLDFLPAGTATVLGLRPDENGVVNIDRERLGDKHMVFVVIQDPAATMVRQLILDDSALSFRDLRLSNGLDPDTHVSQRKQYSILKRGELFELSDVAMGKFQHYDDLGDVYRLYKTLSNDAHLNEFSFITRWPSLSEDEKRKLYNKYACHELHFFLMHKDPEFFQETVKPYLENKLSKMFMDLWLIEDDLNAFARPWEFKRLNTVEQALLGRRSEARREQLTKFIDDAYQLNPIDRQQFTFWFGVLVSGSALDTDGVSEWLEEKRNERVRNINGLADLQQQKQAGITRSQLGRSGGPGGAGKSVAPDPTASPRPSRGVKPNVAMDQAGQIAANKQALSELRAGENAAKDRTLYAFEPQFADGDEGLERDLTRKLGAKGYFRGGQDFGRDIQLREELKQLYRRLEPTQEWVENNYYHLPIEQQTSHLVDANRFWLDYARHREGPFLSPYFVEASGNFTEMMLALAVLDLPFEEPEHEFEFVDDQMRLTPNSDLIAFYQEVKPAVFDRRGSSVLVSENFFRKDDRHRIENGKQYDKFIRDEFVTHVLYGAQVVITNPTSTPQEIDLLVQIPAGAIAASGSQETKTMQMDLASFSSTTMEYFFYFPAAGDFAHYPAHVSVEDRVTAVADPLRFRVVAEPSEVDTTSWAFVSQNGSPEQVLDFLRQRNLQNLDLSKIAFRMKDANYFDQVIEVLVDRFAYDHTLWSYAVKHNRPKVISQFLKHADSFLAQCGKYLNCELLQLDAVERRWYEHREFWPLVNARSHQLGSRRTILNDRIWQQYHDLMAIISNRSRLGDADHLAVAYYLFLQDRFDEALRHFDKVDAGALQTRIQYDYCAAYAALLREDIDRARQIAGSYSNYPVDRWRELFQGVSQTVAEIDGESTASSTASADAQSELAKSAPSFEFSVESRQTTIRYQNLTEVAINYYQMDIELLFSRNPFVQKRDGGFAMIRPNHSQRISLPADKNEISLPLPQELQNSNVLVEISGAGNTQSQAYFAHSLNTQIVDQYGHLLVTHANDKRPLPEVYVKVYARKTDGSVHFYKDGYTDLRGRFDFASLSNQELDDLQQFSMLVLSPEHGAVVRQAGIPKE